MKFCFDEYAEHAFGKDEIEPRNGGSRDWIGLGVTLVDSLDTLFVTGLKKEFAFGVQWVEANFLNPPSGLTGSFFEISIRALGGLLGAHSLSGEPVLLEKAVRLGEILSRNAFPAQGQFLPHKVIGIVEVTGERSPGGPGGLNTNIAEAGSEQLEFRYLARSAKNEDLAKYPDLAMQALVDMSKQMGYC